MKLIRCHVENFGKLVNYDYNFVDGFNQIKAANGWGKSTLATFIKAMFYGLPATTKRNLNENERKKYSPWQGGNYGGNLVFALKQKQYKIERFFGKNQNEDTFKIIDLSTGKKTNDYTARVGEEIFGLDAEAFERSSYIPQKILNSNFNQSIAQKLNQMIQGTTEDFHYEAACANLDKKRVSLSNNKKTGQVENLKSQIEDVVAQIRELETRGQALDVLQQQVNRQDEVIQALALEQNQIQQQINQYGQLQEKQANQTWLTKLNQQVVATQNEIKDKQSILNQQQTTVVEIESYLTAAQAVSAKNDALAMQSNGYAQQRYQALTDYFKHKIPSAETVQTVYQDVLRYQMLKAQNTARQANSPANNQKRQRLCWGLLILALGCLVGGVFSVQVQWLVGVLCFVGAFAFLCAAGFIYLINLINVKTTVVQHPSDEQWHQDQNLMAQLQKTITTFLSQYETDCNDDLAAINRVKNNLDEYLQIQAQITQSADEVSALSQDVAKEMKHINDYLSRFKFKNAEQTVTEKLTLLKQTLYDLDNLNKRLNREIQELEQFKRDKHFDSDVTAVINVDIDDLQRNERTLQDRIDTQREERAQLVARMNKIQDDLAGLNDLESEKANLQNELKNAEQNLSAVKNAMKFLQVANQSLSTKFLAPMKNGLIKYLKLMTKQDFSHLNLDTDFQITFEEYGQLREVDYYSNGYQNVIDLCMRFALIDVLYDKEKPVIILDDPFINLDDDKVGAAKQFLQTLAQNYQIIYFSCHESRC